MFLMKLTFFAVVESFSAHDYPLYMRRIGKRKEQIQFSLLMFGILAVVWFVFVKE